MKYKKVLIKQISGIETEPFLRFRSNISLQTFIRTLQESQQDGWQKGFSNLSVNIIENDGLVDINLYGETPLTEEDLLTEERIQVILRTKDETSKGETREKLLK